MKRTRQTTTKKQPYIAEKKQQNNEKCLCGSGKKYKHCCKITNS